MNKKTLIDAILSMLIEARKENAQSVYFGALTGRDGSRDWETLGDLIDLIKES